MNASTCSSEFVLFALGFIVLCVPMIQFIRYGWLERKRGLNSKAYILLSTMGWTLFTVSISLIGIGIFGLDKQRCVLSENSSLFLILVCSGISAIILTLLFLITIWMERIRRLAREQKSTKSIHRSRISVEQTNQTK